MDTVTFTKKLLWPKKNKFVITSYVNNGAIKIDSASVLVFYEENRQPEFSIEGNLTITPDQTCSLRVIVSDPDKDQKHTIVAKNGEVSNVLESNLYIWKPTDGFTGTKDIIFQVTDNGDPSLSEEQKVTITVLGNAPHWDIQDTMKVKLSAGLTYTLKLRDTCTDARDSNLAFTLLPGKPDKDTIDNGIYKFASTESDTGKYHVTIIAKNKFGQADTLFLQLVLMYIPAIKDTIPPVLRRDYPLTDSISVSASEVAIKLVCIDAGGMGSVTGTLDTNQFTATKTNDTLYTIVVSKLPADKYSMLTITASDKSGNSSSIKVFIKYDPSMVDNTKPILTPVNPLNTNIKTANTSVDIQISCKDESGISSVICKKNGTNVETTKKDSLYSATITGLVSGRTDTVRFIAFDNSPVKNCDTLIYLITCDQALNDTTGPDIKFITPSKDSSKTNSSAIDVRLSCTDNNSVALVTCTRKEAKIPVTKDTGNTYIANVKDMVVGINTLLFTATDGSSKSNETVQTLAIIYDPSLNDNVGPEIQLKTPSKDNDTIGSSSLNVEILCNDNSGIASVTCSSGTTEFKVSKVVGDVYSASVSGLQLGNNEITFTATDSSANFNKKVKKITINYDPKMGDNVPPQVSLKNPTDNGQRVFQDTITVTIVCKDTSGIDSVSCIFAKKPIVVKKSADSLYSAYITGLTMAGSDTVTFTVKDKRQNSRIFPVIIKYNTLIGPVTALTPEDKKTAVELQPSFTWNGGDDPDGETVYFKVVYGTSESSLTKETGEVSKSPAKITINLACNTTYYWQVEAFSKTNSDVSKSKIMKFTTLDEAPKITKQPENVSVKASQTATFKVTATGTNLRYQWQKGTTDIFDAKDAEYTTGATVDNDNGSTFKCIISNNAGKITSNNAILSILHGITYNANGATSGSVPVDPDYYKSGADVSVKNNGTLVRTGYTFKGWKNSDDGKEYKDGDKLTMGNKNIKLDVVWTLNTYTVTFVEENGATLLDPVPVSHGYKVTKPVEPDKPGYKFTGWYNGSALWDFSNIVTSNLTLTAKWAVAYKITYDGNHNTGGSVPVDEKKYTSGEKAKAEGANTLRNAGCVFGGWKRLKYGKGEIINPGQDIVITQNITLYAVWLVSDFEGNKYTTVQIGDQLWMAENLRSTRYDHAKTISYVPNDGSSTWSDHSGPAYCFYKDDADSAYKAKWGALYNWYALETGEIAPQGWHVPKDEDWTTMTNFLIANRYNYDGTITDNKIAKALAAKTDWANSIETGAPGNETEKNDTTGFSALPGGWRNAYGTLDYQGSTGYWWSATEVAGGGAYYRYLNHFNMCFNRDEYLKLGGFSVRLVRD